MSGSIDLSPYIHAQAERYSWLACTVFLGYEHLLQFGNEVELFWKKRMSFGKCLFIWSRYFNLAFSLGNVIVYMQPHPSLLVRITFILRPLSIGCGLQSMTTHVILVLRVYAMYGSSRLILAVCSSVILAEAICIAVIFSYPRPGLYAGNNPAPGLFICVDGDPEDGPWIAYYWTVLLIGESILLCLSLYKGWQNYRTGYGGQLMRGLTRDSLLYFSAIFFIYLMNNIVWVVNIHTLNELGTSFAVSVSAVLGNRLMITVRDQYYGVEERFEDAKRTTGLDIAIELRHKRAGGSLADGSTTAVDTYVEGLNYHQYYEMLDYSERRGF